MLWRAIALVFTPPMAMILGLLISNPAEAFFMHVEGERTSDTFSATGLPMGNVWRKPVYELDVFSQYTGAMGAACTQPYNPLRTGNGFKLWSPTMANSGLLEPFSYAIGCANNALQEQMLTLEMMYETSDTLDFLNGSVQFHGLDTEDATINYCATQATVAFTWHERYQNLVLWDRKPRPPVKTGKMGTVPEPSTLILMLYGVVLLIWAARSK